MHKIGEFENIVLYGFVGLLAVVYRSKWITKVIVKFVIGQGSDVFMKLQMNYYFPLKW